VALLQESLSGGATRPAPLADRGILSAWWSTPRCSRKAIAHTRLTRGYAIGAPLQKAWSILAERTGVRLRQRLSSGGQAAPRSWSAAYNPCPTSSIRDAARTQVPAQFGSVG